MMGGGALHTIIVPVFNEDLVLRELHRRLMEVLEARLRGVGDTWEVVFVNDGSCDGSEAVLRELRAADPEHVRVISFARNFGHEAAITAGLDHAAGDTVIMMDADLQDPPEVVLDMIARWREGYEVVYGMRILRKKETWFKKTSAALFYRLLRTASELDVPLDAGDFRLLSRRAARALAAMRETHRFLRGMTRWLGFRQIAVTYVRAPRFAGATKYSMRRMWHLAWDGMTGFSLLPLRLTTVAGAVAIPLGAALGACALVSRVAGGAPLHRTAVIVAVNIFMGGLILVALGIVGEYVGRAFEQAKGRPLYVIDYAEGIGTLDDRSPAPTESHGHVAVDEPPD
jgi:polyisoprenyl-phosphate glycosyltransferase